MKTLLKSVANFVACLLMLPLLACYLLLAGVSDSARVFPGFAQLVSLLPGTLGVYLRKAFLQRVLPMVGEDVWIGFMTVFSHPTAQLGDHVYLGVGCMIGDVDIEQDVLIGSHVSLINGNRQHGLARLDVPVREQPGEFPKIRIGADTWIGDRSIVMCDIGKHAVVGAGSVVTKPVDDYAIVVGNPARLVGSRRDLQQTHSPPEPEVSTPDRIEGMGEERSFDRTNSDH